MTFGLTSATAASIYTALAAAVTTNALFDSEQCFLACSNGQCVLTCADLDGTTNVFEVYFRSSTAYTSGVTIGASTPA